MNMFWFYVIVFALFTQFSECSLSLDLRQVLSGALLRAAEDLGLRGAAARLFLHLEALSISGQYLGFRMDSSL